MRTILVMWFEERLSHEQRALVVQHLLHTTVHAEDTSDREACEVVLGVLMKNASASDTRQRMIQEQVLGTRRGTLFPQRPGLLTAKNTHGPEAKRVRALLQSMLALSKGATTAQLSGAILEGLFDCWMTSPLSDALSMWVNSVARLLDAHVVLDTQLQSTAPFIASV